ncbi:MAG: tRNA pseudouridine(38-40) synthase TruA [Candidatus Omnitrophica bacterium]|nr:tRNA pseudouridine(38-40) synthase TruA [Candidatus Omnitrophota bacterium]
MRNLKLEIEYEGASYCGWQVQTRNKKKKSIQSVLESALSKILQERIHLAGSGRTDAGTHALAQVANFRTSSNIPLKKLRLGLNALLPDDIVIAKIKEVGPSFHSRFDAKSKVYRYIILNRSYPSAMLRNKAYFYPYPLDTRLMQQEAGVLLGRHNFKSFQARDKKERDPVKTIKKIRVSRNKDFIYVDIEADGFLYNMVRNIAGTLVEIGRGKISRGSLKKILLSRDRRIAGPTLSACGLYLVKVKY